MTDERASHSAERQTHPEHGLRVKAVYLELLPSPIKTVRSLPSDGGSLLKIKYFSHPKMPKSEECVDPNQFSG